MGDKKHFVFSARTTKAGLGILNELKDSQKISWDELIIPAINAFYAVTIPMPEKPPVDEAKLKAKADREEAKAAAKAEREERLKAKANVKAKAIKAKADKVKAAEKAGAAKEKAAKEKAAAKIAKANTAPATSEPATAEQK